MWVVALRCGDVCFVGNRLAREQADAGIVAAFRKVVADLELILASAELAGRPCREVVGKGEEDLGAKGLEKRAPAVAWHGGLERTDALRGNNRDALRLAGQTEELFVSGRFVLANGDEVLVFVAKEQGLAEVLIWMRFDRRDAIENGALKIELHHHAQGSGKSRVHGHRKVQGADLAAFDQPTKRWKRCPVTIIGVGQRVIALRRRAEGPFHTGIVIEQGKKNRDSLDNGCSELWLDAAPVVVVPALDCLQLFLACGIDPVETSFAQALKFDRSRL